jgi:hypothetical protein
VNKYCNIAIFSFLAIVITLVLMHFSEVDIVFAQSGDNTLGQEGDGNEASQSESSS